ncbi:MAG TPA: anthranilate phosphoribosyltransferase [Pseudomonadales bacterium]|nr:anthranilate phosphoribosyltransferase [Pseudomonadales bacterium]
MNAPHASAVQQGIAQLVDKKDLSHADMHAAMMAVMSGEATAAQIGAFLVALRMKGETVTEITAAAEVMRALSTPVAVNIHRKHLVDTCGTGGSGIPLFNVSTASAFVVACAGGFVAKHGNRSVTSKSGSADLLEAAGVNLDLTPEQVTRSINETGVGFMFAVRHHNAMKHAIGPRREIGVRTIFNVLGPLTNPAGAPNQVLGVFHAGLVRPIADVLKNLGSEHVMVVHSQDGLDEISLAAPTHIAELKDGVIREYTITPEELGLQRQSIDALMVANAVESLALVKTALTDNHSAAADIVALNAGAAIYAANLCSTFKQGVDMARDVLGTGIAWEKMQEFAVFTQHVA